MSADGAVRATVDTDVVAVDQSRRGSVRLGPAHRADPEIVLEVKADEDRRAELERVLSEWPVRISRNSKFARGIAGGVAS